MSALALPILPHGAPRIFGPVEVGFLYLVRHGQTDWNREGRWQGQTDTLLNDTGRAKATHLGQRLAHQGIARVIASSLARAQETARIVSELVGAGPVGTDMDLRERSFGCFEGLTRDECEARFPDAWARYLLDRRQGPMGAESFDDVHRRMKAAIERASSALHDGQSTLLVSHGGAIRIWWTATTGQPLPPVGNGDVLRFELGAGILRYIDTVDHQGMRRAP